jgi:hypothetical protein
MVVFILKDYLHPEVDTEILLKEEPAMGHISSGPALTRVFWISPINVPLPGLVLPDGIPQT